MGWCRSPDVIYEVVDGRAMLVDPAGTEFLTLNEVGTLVWQALDGVRGSVEIAKALIDRVDGVGLEEFERDVGTFLAETHAAGLVQRTDDAGGIRAPSSDR